MQSRTRRALGAGEFSGRGSRSGRRTYGCRRCSPATPAVGCTGHVQHLDFLFPPRRGTFSRRVDTDPRSVAAGARAVHRLHPPVLCRQRRRGRDLGGVPASAVRPVHVGHLSDAQFEGHQLPSEVRARCRRRRHPLFYVRVSGARAAGHWRGERCVRTDPEPGSRWPPASRRCSSSAPLFNWLAQSDAHAARAARRQGSIARRSDNPLAPCATCSGVRA